MSEERKGELLAFTHALIWSLFPVITVLSYRTVPSMVSLTISTFLAGIPFFAILIYKKKLAELKNPLIWRYIPVIILATSLLYYSLYYYGLTKTTPGNASLIALFEVLTSYIFFHVIRREHFSFESKIGSVLMLLGAAIVLLPGFSSFNSGDIFIVFATLCAPVGNLFQQKARKVVSTETLLFLRSLTATPLLFGMTYMFGQHFSVIEIKESFWFLAVNGLIIFSLSKIFWIESISRVPVTKAIALSSMAPLFTLFFAYVVLSQAPTVWQITSLIPFFFGTLLLTDNLKLNYAKRH